MHITVHSDGADCVLSKMLGHFKHQPGGTILDLQSIEDRWESIFKLYINDSTDNSYYLPLRATFCRSCRFRRIVSLYMFSIQTL